MTNTADKLDTLTERIRDKLPPRPLYMHDSAALNAGVDCGVYWVRGGTDHYDMESPTQIVVEFDGVGLAALKYYASDGQWKVIETVPMDEVTVDRLEELDDELNRVGSSHAEWHKPIAESYDIGGGEASKAEQ